MMTGMPNYVYIDGSKRRIVEGSREILVVDSDELPGRPCASYRIGASAMHVLLCGVSVRTLGHTYSFTEPVVKVSVVDTRTPPEVKPIKALPPAHPPTLRQRVAQGLHKLANLIGGTS